MLNGIGFQEIGLIALLVLVLFGPRGVSGIMRDLGKWAGKLKRYRDEFTREMMALSEPELDEAQMKENERKRIRLHCRQAVAEMAPEKRKADSARIALALVALPAYREAASIFCFLSLPEEVNTFPVVEQALADGKRVFVPYCVPKTAGLGISRITDPGADLIKGAFGIPEPREELRRDAVDPLSIDLFIIPGLSFDHQRNRLGRGKGCFDRFLKDIKGKKTIVGICFDEQVHPYVIPARDGDVRPDLVITPSEKIGEVADA